MVLANGKIIHAFDEEEIMVASPAAGLLPSFIGQPCHYFTRLYYPGGKIAHEHFEVWTGKRFF